MIVRTVVTISAPPRGAAKTPSPSPGVPMNALRAAFVVLLLAHVLAPRGAVAQQAAQRADADFPPPKFMALTVVDAATNRPLDGVRLTASTNGQPRSLITDD